MEANNISMENEKYDKDKLVAFFKKVIEITLKHDVINHVACVKVSRLEQALMEVNKEWYNQ